MQADQSSTEAIVELIVSPPKVETTSAAARDAADNLVQLYKRISLDHELDEAVRSDFLRRLTGAAGAAQQTLRPVNPTGQNGPGNTTTTTTVAVGGHNVSPTHGR